MSAEIQHEIGFTSEEFERWIAQQVALGFTIRNPDAVEKVRAEFKKRGDGHVQIGTISRHT